MVIASKEKMAMKYKKEDTIVANQCTCNNCNCNCKFSVKNDLQNLLNLYIKKLS